MQWSLLVQILFEAPEVWWEEIFRISPSWAPDFSNSPHNLLHTDREREREREYRLDLCCSSPFSYVIILRIRDSCNLHLHLFHSYLSFFESSSLSFSCQDFPPSSFFFFSFYPSDWCRRRRPKTSLSLSPSFREFPLVFIFSLFCFTSCFSLMLKKMQLYCCNGIIMLWRGGGGEDEEIFLLSYLKSSSSSFHLEKKGIGKEK